MTKILIIDNGIEFDAVICRKKPIGGAETAFVSLVESLAKLNFEVVVYNNSINTGLINGVYWNKLDNSIVDQSFDFLIINRGDKYLNFKKSFKKRFFWIHNPAKYLIKWRYLSKLLFNHTTIVFSSEYHLKTYPIWAPAKDKVIIPYGIDDFILDKRKKISPPHPQAIFTSNPLRGLNWLLDRWEYEIFPKVPNAKLHLYTGSSTYGSFGRKHLTSMTPILQRANDLKHKGVLIFEPVKRRALIDVIQKSRVLLYQGSNDETFCMSVAESQTLCVPSVVCDLGSMSERVINNQTGFVCDKKNEFSNSVIKLLRDNDCWNYFHDNLIKNQYHKSWEEVAKMWQDLLR